MAKGPETTKTKPEITQTPEEIRTGRLKEKLELIKRSKKVAEALRERKKELSPEQQEKLWKELTSILRTISGRYDINVTGELDQLSKRSLGAQGKEADDTWFYYRNKDRKTGRLVEYVHFPKKILVQNENVARGIAAHEAGHILITRMGDFLPDDILRKIGFHSLIAACEERPTDQVVRDRFEAAGEWVSESRRESHADGEISSKIMGRIGYIPKVQQLGNLFVYGPYFDQIPRQYDKDVIKKYIRLHDVVKKFEHTLPRNGATESEIEAVAVERYRIFYEEIWPEVQDMIEADKKNAELQQMLTDIMSGNDEEDLFDKLPEDLKAQLKELMDAMAAGGQSPEMIRQQQLMLILKQKLIDILGDEAEAEEGEEESEPDEDEDPFDAIDKAAEKIRFDIKDILQDIEEGVLTNLESKKKENNEESIDELLNKNLKKRSAHLLDNEDEVPLDESGLPEDIEQNLQAAIEDLIKQLTGEKPPKGDGGGQGEPGEGEGSEGDESESNGGESDEGDEGDESESNGGESDEGDEGDESENNGGEGESSEGNDHSNSDNRPKDMNNMSDELRQKLQEMWDNLPDERKEELRKKAEQSMQGIEDDYTKGFEGNLSDEHNPESHEERQEREAAEAEQDKREAEAQQREIDRRNRQEEINQEMERIRKELEKQEMDKTKYQQVYESLRKEDSDLYRVLSAIFNPSLKKEMVLKSFGTKINLPAVFRMKAAKSGGAKNVPTKIFESTHRPEKMDYTFTILLDMSGSMSYSGKIEEAFKAIVLLTEVLNRLGIKIEILGFQHYLYEFKKFDEKLDDNIRSKMSAIVNLAGSANDDGACLWEAANRLAAQSGKNKFMLVISDGQPAGSRSNVFDLYKAIEKAIKEKNINLVGLGLGPHTEFVRNYYPVSVPGIRIDQLAQSLGELLKSIVINPQAFKSALGEEFEGKLKEYEDVQGGVGYFDKNGNKRELSEAIATDNQILEMIRIIERERSELIDAYVNGDKNILGNIGNFVRNLVTSHRQLSADIPEDRIKILLEQHIQNGRPGGYY